MRRDRFDPLEVPNYGFQEAVRYLHVPNSTLRYWMRPSINLLAPVDRERRLFSFKNLVECYVLNGLREILLQCTIFGHLNLSPILANQYKINTLSLVGPVAQRLEQRTHKLRPDTSNKRDS